MARASPRHHDPRGGVMSGSKSRAVLLLVAAVLACARAAGRNATEASFNVVKDQQEAVEMLAKVAGDKAVEGAAHELTMPETSLNIDRAVEAAMEKALSDLNGDLEPGGRLSRTLNTASANA